MAFREKRKLVTKFTIPDTIINNEVDGNRIQ